MSLSSCCCWQNDSSQQPTWHHGIFCIQSKTMWLCDWGLPFNEIGHSIRLGHFLLRCSAVFVFLQGLHSGALQRRWEQLWRWDCWSNGPATGSLNLLSWISFFGMIAARIITWCFFLALGLQDTKSKRGRSGTFGKILQSSSANGEPILFPNPPNWHLLHLVLTSC